MNKFSTIIASDSDHEKVFAEIYCNEKFVALVSQERGMNALELEFPGSELDEGQVLRCVSLAGFQEALGSAVDRMRG